MPSNPTNTVLHHLRRTALAPHGAGLADGELLECFLIRREESAFAALVRRHGPMVLGVCRRILKNAHDAEDAFQATFLVLVRKAASFLSRQTVGDFLYGVACRTALKARAAAARRRLKERQVADMPRPEARDEEAWRELRPVLDRELNRLPARYRAPVVLCDLEEKTRKEAARLLGWPEGTVSSRLARARALLARRLSRHGLALSGSSLALLLGRESACACVPAALAASTVKAAAAAGAVSAPVAALIQGVLTAMFLNKLKTTLVVILALGIVGAGTGILLRPVLAQKPSAADVKGKPTAPGKEEGIEVSGVVRAVDAGQSTLTLGGKTLLAKTFEVAKDVKVLLDDGSGGKLGFREGRLSDVAEGASVTVRLSGDRKTIVGIWVDAPQVRGTLKSVAGDGRKITLEVPVSKTTSEEKVFDMAENVPVYLAGKGKERAAPAHLADLPVGALVTLKLSAARKVVVAVQAEWPEVHGTVKAVDGARSTITVEVQEGKQAEEKMFSVLPTASIGVSAWGKGKSAEARLADVPVGAQVTLKLSLDRRKAVMSLWAEGVSLTGVVKAVDAGKNTLTLTVARKGEAAEEKTFEVPGDAAVSIDGKEGKLADLPVEAVAHVRLSPDRKKVAAVEAEGRTASRTVKGVDAARGSITLGSKAGEETYAVGKDAVVLIDGKEGKLSDVPMESLAMVRLSADGKTVRHLGIEGPKVQGTFKAVDAARRKLTVSVRVNKTDFEDRVFEVAKDAEVRTAVNGVPLKLADLKGDKEVVLQMSADQKSVRHITVLGE